MPDEFDTSSSVERLKLLALFKRLDAKKASGLTEAEQKLYTELSSKISGIIDPKSKVDAQKRKDLRVPIHEPIQLHSSKDFQKFYLKNISGGGFYIESKKLYEMGTKIEFELEWVEKKKSLKLKGEVVWINPKTLNDLKPGMGLKFVDLDADQNKFLQDMIHDLLNRAMSSLERMEKKKK